MDKIILSTSDIDFILRWRDEHKDLVRLGICPIKAVKIEVPETKYIITAVREGNKLSFGINHNGRSEGKIVIELLLSGMYKVLRNTTKYGTENVMSVATVYSSTMALIAFGDDTIKNNEIEHKNISHKKNDNTRKPTKKNKQISCTYILKRSGNAPRIVTKGSHSKPEGMFSVRGHYRHYKNGKTIWIDEYTKGCGKKKDKTYKVGSKNNKKD